MTNFMAEANSRLAAKTASKLRRREKLICGVFMASIVLILAIAAPFMDISGSFFTIPIFVGFAIGYLILPLFLSRDRRNLIRVFIGGCLATFLTGHLGYSSFEFIFALRLMEFHYALKSLIPNIYILIVTAILSPFVGMMTIRLDRYLFEYRQKKTPVDILIGE